MGFGPFGPACCWCDEPPPCAAPPGCCEIVVSHEQTGGEPGGPPQYWETIDWGFDCETGEWFFIARVVTLGAAFDCPQDSGPDDTCFGAPYNFVVTACNDGGCNNSPSTPDPCPVGTVISVSGTVDPRSIPAYCHCEEFPTVRWLGVQLGAATVINGPAFSVFSVRCGTYDYTEPGTPTLVCGPLIVEDCFTTCVCGELFTDLVLRPGSTQQLCFATREDNDCAGKCADGSNVRISWCVERLSQTEWEITITASCNNEPFETVVLPIIEMQPDGPEVCVETTAIINGHEIPVSLGNHYFCTCGLPPSPCVDLPYCVECSGGDVESGVLVDGIGVTVCGQGGPFITMTDNGDDTVTITQFFDFSNTELGTFDCPFPPCLEFTLDDGSVLKLGEDCDECVPPACAPFAYCVECNAGTVEAGVLTDGVGVVMCGGPVLTMSDNGNGTVTITQEYQGTRVLGTFDCPIVGCLEFTRLAIPISTLRIGPDCECDTPPPASCDTLAYCVECVSGFVESGILTDGVGVVMCGGPLIIMTDNGDDTVTITQFFDSVFTILGTFDCPVTGCLLFQLDDASTLKLGPACVCE